MKNIKKTTIFTLVLSFVCILAVGIVQFRSEKSLASNCSYFDPITIDLLAFLAALFLVIEGIYRIHEHKDASLKKQLTRAVRIAFGASILTLHLIQFFHK